jgi:tRNA nucleotidyltransferase (CCA-adding enzyme)
MDNFKDNIDRIIAEDPYQLNSHLPSLVEGIPTFDEMQGFDQENPHHDKDLMGHTLDVVDYATQFSLKPEVYVAALYHDSGKIDTKEYNEDKGHYTYHGHESAGAERARRDLTQMGFDQTFIDDVCLLIENHMRPLGYQNQPFGNKGVRRLVRRSEGNNVNIDDLMDLNKADIMGHNPDQVEESLEAHQTLRNHIERVREF